MMLLACRYADKDTCIARWVSWQLADYPEAQGSLLYALGRQSKKNARNGSPIRPIGQESPRSHSRSDH